MGWTIKFALWFVATPPWILLSFYSGSNASNPDFGGWDLSFAPASKLAFIPPALVFIVLVLQWLFTRSGSRFGAESEASLGAGVHASAVRTPTEENRASCSENQSQRAASQSY